MVICSDFDGTLNSSTDPLVLSTNLLAVRKWREAGHAFVLVTGRNHAIISSILPDWQKYIDYLIMDNGGATFSNQDQLIHVYKLERSLIYAIRSLVCNRAMPISYSPERCSIDLMVGETAIKLRLYFRTEELLKRCHAQIEDQNWPIKVLPWLKPGFSKLPDGTNPNRFYGFLDIVHKDSGKECAIQRLVNIKYPQSDIITIGDDYNDIAMLSRFRGFAINGSPNEIIAAANGRTITSVANLIYQHL